MSDVASSPDYDALCARLKDAVEAWSWHPEDEDRREGYGAHMAQMFARLPVDGQTRDMVASIRQMLIDLDAALYHLGVAIEAGYAIPPGSDQGPR